MQIVNLFYELARQQKEMRGFKYGKGGEKGAGSDAYPLTWLDDPLLGSSARADGGVIRWTVNVDILGIPKNDAEVKGVQDKALLIGLSYFEKAKEIKNTTGLSIESYNFITLRHYYDDDAAGCRFTFTITSTNPIDRCADYFDPDKEFDKNNPLPDFITANPNGCAVFNDKPGLPNFNI